VVETNWKPCENDYVTIDCPVFGGRAYIVTRRALGPAGERGIVSGGEWFSMDRCRPLDWQPMPGMSIAVISTKTFRHGLIGRIIRLHDDRGMPLATCQLENGDRAELLFDWIAPLESIAPSPEVIEALLDDLDECDSWGHVDELLSNWIPCQRKLIWAACPAALKQRLWALRNQTTEMIGLASDRTA
jgi:hypothetical protein